MYYRNPNLLFTNDQNATKPRFVNDMTALFLYWLEYQAIENGALVQ
jgi:hypothetical protein